MIQSLNEMYTSVSGGTHIDKINVKKLSGEPIYLVKTNYLGEFKSKLERAKVKRNLGIIDSESIVWSDITGNIEDNLALNAFLLNVPFNRSLLGSDMSFSDIKSLQDAVIYVFKENLQVQEYNAAINNANTNAAQAKNLVTSLISNLYGQDESIPSGYGRILSIESNVSTNTNDISNIKNIIGVEAGSTENSLIQRLNELDLNILSLGTQLDATNTKIGESDGSTENSVYAAIKTLDDETKDIRDNSETIISLASTVSGHTTSLTNIGTRLNTIESDITTISDVELPKYYLKTTADSTFATITSLNDYYKVTDADDKFATKTSLSDYYTITGADNKFVTKDSLGGTGTYNFVDLTELNSILTNYLKIEETNIPVSKQFDFTGNFPGDARRYVENKSDLLNIPASKAWNGMEVIVVNDSTMYILKDISLINDSEYAGWKAEAALALQTLTYDEYKTRKTEGTLDANVYYYIIETEDEYETPGVYPLQEEGESDEDYQTRLDEWNESIRVLHNEYMSAIWGLEIESRVNRAVTSDVTLAINDNVGQLRTSVNTLTSSVNTVQSNFTSLLNLLYTGEDDGDVQVIQHNIESLQQAIVALTLRIQALETTE